MLSPDDTIKILVVDDDPSAAALYKRLLEEQELTVDVETAADGATARKRLSQSPSDFDIVTLDYKLPDETGLVLLEDIAEGEDNPPVIIVTAYGDVHLAARSFQMGASGYVIKDFTLPKTLADVIRDALTKAALKRASDVLDRENAFTGVAVNALDELFFVIDLEGRFMSWNTKLKDITGFTERELHRMAAAEVFSRDETRRLLQQVTSARKGEKTVLRLYITASDGRRIPFELTAVMIHDGEGLPVGICAIGQEVGWSRRIPRGIQDDELERPSGVVELTGDIIARVDYDGRFTFLSDAACAFWGKSRDALAGRELSEFVHTEDLDRSIDTWSYALRTGRMIRGFVNRQSTPRGWRSVEWNAVPVFDQNEVYTGFQFTGRDVTDKVITEEFLLQVNRELDAYAHTVSHDLKGPLSAIMLAADTLRVLIENQEVDQNPDGTLHEMARIISHYTAEAGSLVEDMLLLAESGQVPLEVEEVDVAEVVGVVRRQLAKEIEGRGVVVRLSDDLGMIRGSRVQVTQIFSNLISNAVVHNDSEEPLVEVTYLGEGSDVGHRYVIRDNGSGIPPENMNKIFKPFFRGNPGGAGIGLATVEKIVKVYDGFVRAYNDCGACFEFCIRDIERKPPENQS